ncbi:oligopeptide/dipeptide ABC transporter ATP-binding protein [Micromonospora sp. WMMB482]|uniref:oligopeptide/dipeptide ABC transporter ATP-binding protein n=1 Tax=Micromonospora sp. WMMB482 TaxID=2849653 RepID=UPI002738773D|nr:oligopeptide/dipeptide ABC transporter ATP-binding protein [Micromonospora sp. WMMB482]
MKLLLDLRERLGFALILVSHDLALVSDVCDRVVVMYGGQIVETGVTADVMEAPAHHYARGLLGSVLSLETGAERLTQIRGVVPSPADFPKGCRFSDRCPMATGICRDTAPALEGTDGHGYACHHPRRHRQREGAGPMSATAEHRPIAELSDVHVVHASRGGGMFSREKVYALTGADLVIRSGETVGIVGESGCGKSTLAKVLVACNGRPPARCRSPARTCGR